MIRGIIFKMKFLFVVLLLFSLFSCASSSKCKTITLNDIISNTDDEIAVTRMEYYNMIDSLNTDNTNGCCARVNENLNNKK